MNLNSHKTKDIEETKTNSIVCSCSAARFMLKRIVKYIDFEFNIGTIFARLPFLTLHTENSSERGVKNA